MLGRIISIGIVAFWLVMMTLLVRSEFFQSNPLQYSIPVEVVMQKMFNGEGASDLAIYYQGDRVGRCTLQITKTKTGEVPTYSVRSELALDFALLGRTVRLQSNTDSEFDKRYQMRKFQSRTTTGEAQIDLRGDFESQKIDLVMDLGNGYQEKHSMPFAALANMGPSGAMGLFGMGGLQAPTGGQKPAGDSAFASLSASDRGPTTVVHDMPLIIGRERIPAMMVHTKYDESLWSKVYVNTAGEILKVETSFGVTMLGTQFAGIGAN